MPEGFEGIREAAAERAAKMAAGGGGGTTWFRLRDDGDSAVVRFLEPSEGNPIHWARMHKIPAEGKNYPDEVPCRDQKREGIDCPGCKAGLDLSITGWVNLIVRDAPKFKTNAEGNWVKGDDGAFIVEGTEDQLQVWELGLLRLELLDSKNTTFKGLMNRDFRITRRGKKGDNRTRYDIEPVLDEEGNSAPSPMSEADIELAKGKTDLSKWTVAPPADDWNYEAYMKMTGFASENGGSSRSGGGSMPQTSESEVAEFIFTRD